MTLVAGGVLVFYNLFQYNMMKVSFKHIDRFVLLAAQFLWSLGLVVLYRLDPELALKQFVCLLIGTPGYDRHDGAHPAQPGLWPLKLVFMGLTLLLLASTLVLGRTTGGAKNWIDLGFISVQPSEFAKILFIVVSAYFLTTRDKLVSFIPYMFFTAVCVMLLVVEKDLGAALLISGTFLIMFYAATGAHGSRFWARGILGGGALPAIGFFSHADAGGGPAGPLSASDGGYQIVQGLMALASGGLLGVGLGRGMPEVIPVRSSDYTFCRDRRGIWDYHRDLRHHLLSRVYCPGNFDCSGCPEHL